MGLSRYFGDDFILCLGGKHFFDDLCWCCRGFDGWKWSRRNNEGCLWGCNKNAYWYEFPQNTRALRIIVEQILYPILCEVSSFDELMQKLKARTAKSRTAKYWVKNLILLVMLMMIIVFIRAEQEGEWTLYLWAVNEMIPFFFTAGHIHYARYGSLIYLRSMQKQHGETLDRFFNGEHVQCHREGLWNEIWTDMFIETILCVMGMSQVVSLE